jgi:hypothetical protein
VYATALRTISTSYTFYPSLNVNVSNPNTANQKPTLTDEDDCNSSHVLKPTLIPYLLLKTLAIQPMKQLQGFVIINPVQERPVSYSRYEKLSAGNSALLCQLFLTPASYSGDPRFKSRPGDRLSWLRFSLFSSDPLRKFQNSKLN